MRVRWNEPGERIGPCGVDVVHEGSALDPLCAQVAFAIQGRTVEIGTAEDLALGGREMERRQQVRSRGKTLDVRKMSQRLGGAVRQRS